MGTTFIEIDNKGFWVRDSILEIWLRLVSLHIDDPKEDDSINSIIRDQWLLASKGFFIGCIPVNLEEFIKIDEAKTIILNAIESLLKKLVVSPKKLDKNVINLLGLNGDIPADIETWRLVEISNAFIDLINGKIYKSIRKTEFMPGSKEKPYK